MDKKAYDCFIKVGDKHWWFNSRKRYVSSWLKKKYDIKQGIVLDVGCGPGLMLNFLSQYGKVFGFDISDYALKLVGNKNISLINGSALSLPFQDNSVSLISAFEVLYHRMVKDDIIALKEFNRVLIKGGRIILTDSAFSFLKGEHDDAAHGIRRYSLKEYRSKLENSGFEVERISYAYALLFPAAFIVRFIKKLFLPTQKARIELVPTNAFLNKLLTFTFYLESLWLKLLPLPFGIVVLALARKIK